MHKQTHIRLHRVQTGVTVPNATTIYKLMFAKSTPFPPTDLQYCQGNFVLQSHITLDMYIPLAMLC